MSGALDGKVAIVTGGARGMGAASVRLFVEEGAKVVIADRLADLGQSLADELGSVAAFRSVDVTQEAEVESLVAFAVERFGGLDIMFNNAGILIGGPPVDLLDDDFAAVTKEFAVNTYGPLYGIKHAGRVMRASGKGGSIIITASSTATWPGLNAIGYRMSKAAAISLTKNAALALGKYGIRVNAISPGPTATPIFTDGMGLSPERSAAVIEAMMAYMVENQQVLKRSGTPEDIAQAALYLASDRSAQVTGIDLPVTGGEGLGDRVDRLAGMGAVLQSVLG